MTKVSFIRDSSSALIGFSVNGHAGYAEAGEDIVCAGISSCTELVLNTLDAFGFDSDTAIDPARALVSCKISESVLSEPPLKDAASKILEGLYRTLKDMTQEYPRHIKCNITEV